MINGNFLAGLAVVIAVTAFVIGVTGSDVAGPQGPQGPRGEQGPAGRNGIDGVNGVNGVNGKDGSVVLGATGDQHYNVQSFFGDIRTGGNRIASSTSASVTLAGTEFNNATVLDYTVNGAATTDVTLTLPASTTALCSSLQGLTNQRRVIYIRHATTSATSDLTIAGGSGVLLKKAATSTGATVYGDTDGSSFAQLEIMRKANTDCVAFITVFND